ncbi:MAG: RNA polymerase-associated protein RapA [Methylomonas sp.]|nr:RNA polymerase-associated protein RapA [Methylomonas sp.]PPD22616.1 MAG: RNA polymerase-associated protein RapA [Methylomonas sp.]PPD27927.1 MAG: RNA polymerase-associated protein RapA [Methylomonas sp.]PPD40037.1 MAG: RNA polymerase-associated protein RapA [Methylomonas sp.]PPD41575.1 MAG: RNA polymerase-associated protein RapA [Methylomonas sp.]
MTNDFIAGQRWMSSAESELGLGMILDAEFNRVTVLFLATGDKRTYARDNAPLTRVRFNESDVIESVDFVKITVTGIEERNGLLTYVGIDDEGRTQHIDEMELNHHIQFNKPQDRLFTGQFDPVAWFHLRYDTWKRQQQYQLSAVKGLQGARAALIPHQIYIAHQAANRVSPRVMLADEVGLGKTIEAGLIIQHRLINNLSKRVLVLVPEALMYQWLVEMLRRFNLKFSLFDETRCLTSEDDNPFAGEQLVLCSQQFISDFPERHPHILAAGWDLVVVDEAHHLEWSEAAPSAGYQFVEQLAKAAPGLILLTATPEQLGKESHFARLRLLDPDRFYSFEQFLADEQQFAPVAELANRLISGAAFSADDSARLQALLQHDNVEKLLTQFNATPDDAELRNELIKLLLDHHGTGRILFRNSRHTVKGFPDRERHAYPLQGDASADLADSAYFHWLIDRLKHLGHEKALLICKEASTVIRLDLLLKQQLGHVATVFHEGMSIVERDRAAAFFADEDSSAQLLMCSEIGSEGRNFQFVRHLILFDLPRNPDILQQRIGRLDRIGQKQVIQLHIPYIENSERHCLYRWYDEGFDAFRHNGSAAAQVASRLDAELAHALTTRDATAMTALIAKTRHLNAEIEQALHHGRDQLLELNSCRPSEAADLIAQLNAIDKDGSLWPYMEALFDCYGVDVEYHSRDCHILWPSESLRISHFPLLQDDGLTVTVDRDIALAREDMQFMTQEHPMVLAAMDLVLSSETGNAAVSVVKHPRLQAGQFLLELLFVVECSAPAHLQLERFLPHTPLRIVIDQNRKDVTAAISHGSLTDTGEAIDKMDVVQFLNGQRQQVYAMIKAGESQARQQMQQLLTESANAMIAVMTAEIKRMVRLKKINPGIKDGEIQQMKDMTLLSHDSIQEAQLRLDAVRFVITS